MRATSCRFNSCYSHHLNGTTTNCYATGNVISDGVSSVDGFVGVNDGTITNCYRYSGQIVTAAGVPNFNYSGYNADMTKLQSVSFQSTTLGWSADYWNFSEGTLLRSKIQEQSIK